VPVLFAALLSAHGQLGPAEVRAKGRWMTRDVLRKAALLGVPLRAPRTHPFNPLLALRVSGLEMDAAVRRRLVDGLFRAVWVEQADVADAAVVARIAGAAGLNGARAVERAADPDAKERLRTASEAAIAESVFGVPTMIADGELFWGYDDFPMLERFLAGNDPLDRAALADWSELRPSATRNR
jgi:2-hydroxychromene-2-carboxylate isomerase